MKKYIRNYLETTLKVNLSGAFFYKNNLLTHLLFIVILFTSVLSCHRTEKASDIALTEFQKAIDSVYNAAVLSDGPGAAVLVSYDGNKLISKGYGLRKIEAHKTVTPSTNFRIGSVSKQFTALCILKLMDEGKLSIHDSVEKYLPYTIFHNMTIEQLINHTSGLPSEDDYFLNQWDRSQIVENKDVLNWLITKGKLEFNSGERFKYSNTGYLMLALIVEKASGMEFTAYAKNHVFKPLGMDSTNYFSLAHPIEIPERAFCYAQDSTGKYEKKDGFFMNGIVGDGAVYTSINDFYRYDMALRKKTFLTDNTRKLIFKPSSSEKKYGQEKYYAMGWYVNDSAAYHTGGWLGANAFVMHYLNKPLTIVIFMNTDTLFSSGLIDETMKLSRLYLEKRKK